MNWTTDEFGKYTCDVGTLMRALERTTDQVRQETGRAACVIRLNPADIKAVTDWYETERPIEPRMFRAMLDRPDGVHMFGVLVRPDDKIRPGVALLDQCALPHPRPEDCGQARSARRLTARNDGASWE